MEKAPIISSVSIQKWLRESWMLFKQEPGILLLASVIYFVLMATMNSPSRENHSPSLFWLLLEGPLLVGFYALYFEIMRTGHANFATFFRGFNVYVPAVVANILLIMLSAIGYIFFILPGLLIEALFIFTYPLILEKKMSFWEALMASKEVTKSFLFEFGGFILLKWILYLLGMLFFGIGTIFVFPWFIGSIAVAYREIFGLNQTKQEGGFNEIV